MIQTGDVLFIMHHDNRLSRLIASAMGSRWSHSARVYEPGTRNAYVIETSDLETTFGDVRKYLEDREVEMEVWRPEVPAQLQERSMDRGRYLIGGVYPVWQFISLGIRRLLRRIKVMIGNFLPIGYVCDQVVLYTLTDMPGTSFHGVDPQSMDTEDMYQQLVKDSAFKLVYSKSRGVAVYTYPLK
jgi:hypothetical protein